MTTTPPKIFLLAAALAASLSLAAAVAARAQSGEGTLRGYVTDRATAANGLAGARVELRAVLTRAGEKGPRSHVVVTDRTGNYSTGRVRMGEYVLRITAEGFEPYETTILISSDMEAVIGTLLKKSGASRLVEEVRVEGNRRATAEWVLSHVKTRAGDVYDLEQARRDLEALIDLDAFDDTRTSLRTDDGVRGGVIVTFTVVELPLVGSVKFKGLPEGLTEAEARAYLRDNNVRLAEGDAYEPTKLRWAENYLNELLLKRGVWRQTAKGTARAGAEGRFDVVFAVVPNGND